jgi:hypothetical protein
MSHQGIGNGRISHQRSMNLPLPCQAISPCFWRHSVSLSFLSLSHASSCWRGEDEPSSRGLFFCLLILNSCWLPVIMDSCRLCDSCVSFWFLQFSGLLPSSGLLWYSGHLYSLQTFVVLRTLDKIPQPWKCTKVWKTRKVWLTSRVRKTTKVRRLYKWWRPVTSTTPLPMRYACMGYTVLLWDLHLQYGMYFYRALKFISINCTVVRNT